jgi:hypothetical protein
MAEPLVRFEGVRKTYGAGGPAAVVGLDDLHRGDGRALLRDGAGDLGGEARPAGLQLEAKSDAELRAGGESHVILQIGEGRKDTRRLQIHPGVRDTSRIDSPP